MIIGVPKFERDIMNTMRAPPVTEGMTIGSVTLKNVFNERAPRFSDASSSERSMVMSAPAVMSDTKG